MNKSNSGTIACVLKRFIELCLSISCGRLGYERCGVRIAGSNIHRAKFKMHVKYI